MGRGCCCGPQCPSTLIDFEDGTYGIFGVSFDPPNTEDESWVVDDNLHLSALFDAGSFRWAVPLVHKTRFYFNISADLLFFDDDTINQGIAIFGAETADDVVLYLYSDLHARLFIADLEIDLGVVDFTPEEEYVSLSLTIKEIAGDRFKITAVAGDLTYTTTVSDLSFPNDGETYPMGLVVTYSTEHTGASFYDNVSLAACGPAESSSISRSSSSSSRSTSNTCGACSGGERYDSYTVTADGFSAQTSEIDWSPFNGSFAIDLPSPDGNECSSTFDIDATHQIILRLQDGPSPFGPAGWVVVYSITGWGSTTYTLPMSSPFNCLSSPTLTRTGSSGQDAYSPTTVIVT